MDKIINVNPPEIHQGRLSWHASRLLLPHLEALNSMRGWLTLWDSFGTPGDTLLTGTLARIIRENHPRIKINCVTPHPELLKHDPNIDRLNSAPGVIILRFWYVDIINRKDGSTNVLSPTLQSVGISEYEYKTRVFLTSNEIEWARKQIEILRLERPLITINVQSREKVKVWPVERWEMLVEHLTKQHDVLHLGVSNEPEFNGVTRFAGRLTLRESMAILSQAQLHIGGVSFLMHAANGLDVPSVIIYGGRETPQNSGYAENANLFVPMPCGPCWLHDSRGDICPHEISCMGKISVHEVESAARRLISQNN